jgi:hypothetical protein
MKDEIHVARLLLLEMRWLRILRINICLSSLLINVVDLAPTVIQGFAQCCGCWHCRECCMFLMMTHEWFMWMEAARSVPLMWQQSWTTVVIMSFVSHDSPCGQVSAMDIMRLPMETALAIVFPLGHLAYILNIQLGQDICNMLHDGYHGSEYPRTASSVPPSLFPLPPLSPSRFRPSPPLPCLHMYG